MTSDWVDDAPCREIGPTWFFVEEPGDGYEEGKKVCRTCPFRLQCLQRAVANGERYGLWGGFTDRALRRITHDNALAMITLDEVRHDKRHQVIQDSVAASAERKAARKSSNKYLPQHRAFLADPSNPEHVDGERLYQRESKRLRQVRRAELALFAEAS